MKLILEKPSVVVGRAGARGRIWSQHISRCFPGWRFWAHWGPVPGELGVLGGQEEISGGGSHWKKWPIPPFWLQVKCKWIIMVYWDPSWNNQLWVLVISETLSLSVNCPVMCGTASYHVQQDALKLNIFHSSPPRDQENVYLKTLLRGTQAGHSSCEEWLLLSWSQLIATKLKNPQQ